VCSCSWFAVLCCAVLCCAVLCCAERHLRFTCFDTEPRLARDESPQLAHQAAFHQHSIAICTADRNPRSNVLLSSHAILSSQVLLTEELPCAKDLDVTSPAAAAVFSTPVACAALVRWLGEQLASAEHYRSAYASAATPLCVGLPCARPVSPSEHPILICGVSAWKVTEAAFSPRRTFGGRKALHHITSGRNGSSTCLPRMWAGRRYVRLLREAARAQPLQAPAVLGAVSDALACLRTAAPALSQSLLALAASLLRLGEVEPVLACVPASPCAATPAPMASVAVVRPESTLAMPFLLVINA
jgi:hypothetical protein